MTRRRLFRLGLSLILILVVILGTSIDIGPSVKGSNGIVSLSVNTAVAATPAKGEITEYRPPPQPIIKGTTTFVGKLLNTIRTDNASSSTSNWTNPTNAYADGGGAATVTSGSPSVTQTYGNYNISIAGNVIDSVRVRLDAWTTAGASTNVTREATSDDANTAAFTSTNATRYQAINDSSDTSYITGVTNGGGYATFGYTAFDIAANSTITNVAVYYRHRSNTTGTAASSGTVLKVGGTYYGSGGTLNAYTDNGTASEPASGSAIADRTYLWTINPKSGVAWTVSDVNGSGANALQFFGVGGTDFNPDVNFYKCNVTVNYTTAANENIELDVTWDGGTTWSSSKHSNPTTGSEVTYWDNVTSDTTWTTEKLTDAKFKTRVDALTVGDTGTMNLDWIPVEVTYIVLAPPSSFASTSRTSSSIALSWAKGAGADNTTIRYRTDQYPTGTSDGTLAYSGTGTSTNVTSLSAGQIYYFRAWSYNNLEGVYSSSYSDLTDYTLPGDPSGLASSGVGDNSIVYSWTNGTGGDKTLLRYKIGSYPSSTSDGTQAYFDTGTTTNVTSLSAGTTYYFRAWAYDSDSTYYSSGTTDNIQRTTGLGWLTGYAYRKQFQINGTTAGNMTDYQMSITVNKSTGTDNSTDCFLDNQALSWTGTVPNDLRFTQDDATTQLSYWIESSNTTSGVVWIKYNFIPASPLTATFYLYTGKAGDTTTSNGTATFIVFDDFERGNNGDAVGGNWTSVGGSVTISTDHGYGGTRSGKWAGGGTLPEARLVITATDNMALRWRQWVEAAVTNGPYVQWGTASYFAAMYTSVFDGVARLYYYDTSSHDTGVVTTLDAWQQLEVKNLNFTAHTYDLIHQGSTAKTGANMSAGSRTFVYIYAADTAAGHDVYIDNLIIRNWRSTEPTWGTWGAPQPAVTNTPSTYDFGLVGTSTTPSTGLAYFSMSNNGTVLIDVAIHGTDMTGGVQWTLADNATPDADTVGFKVGMPASIITVGFNGGERKSVGFSGGDNQSYLGGVGQGDYSVAVRKNTTYNTFAYRVPVGAVYKWGLQMFVPTTFSDGVQKSGVITIVASISP